MDGNESFSLAGGLKVKGPVRGSTSITLDAQYLQQNGTTGSGNTNSNGNVLGPSPTTAVAMIILYSITGIITALFLIIIVTGAVRAHRHPERYGPRNVLGRPRQSRAKGIARAMLETIPIVKFGEKEDDKASADVELGATGVANTANAGEVPRVAGEGHESTAEHVAGDHLNGDALTTSPSETAPKMQNESHDVDPDNGLACSVCTDDFIKGQDLRVLPCNHKFHPECIDPWLLNVSGTCPLWYAIFPDWHALHCNAANLRVFQTAGSTSAQQLPTSKAKGTLRRKVMASRHRLQKTPAAMLVPTWLKVHLQDVSVAACRSTSNIHSTSDACVMQHQKNELPHCGDSAP